MEVKEGETNSIERRKKKKKGIRFCASPANGIMSVATVGTNHTSGANGRSMGAEAKNFGVLFTGYLEKRQPKYLQTRYKQRFVVLTQDAIHWFKRDEGNITILLCHSMNFIPQFQSILRFMLIIVA